uniref:LAGLIDADG endonuclease n=1 Tax=Pallidohirschioporus biformis TaxID=50381 RepID=UPI002E78BE5A
GATLRASRFALRASRFALRASRFALRASRFALRRAAGWEAYLLFGDASENGQSSPSQTVGFSYWESLQTGSLVGALSNFNLHYLKVKFSLVSTVQPCPTRQGGLLKLDKVLNVQSVSFFNN